MGKPDIILSEYAARCVEDARRETYLAAADICNFAWGSYATHPTAGEAIKNLEKIFRQLAEQQRIT